jgi:hypothetical protein
MIASRKGGTAMESTESTKNSKDNGRLSVDAPSLDLAKYRDLAGDVAISPEEFNAYLGTLWEIMNGFVQNAWDVRLIPAFLPEIFGDPSDADGDAVDSGMEETDDEA